jgi:heme exporter protein D
VTHLPYVAASYGLALVVGAAFALDAWLRVRRAARRLEAIDKRRQRDRGRGG